MSEINNKENNFEFSERDIEQKERWGKLKFDTIIVFGQGPVKPVLLKEELSQNQEEKWEDFKKDPIHKKEPDFTVIEGKYFLDKLSKTNDPEKIQEERDKIQKRGRFALNRWCRMNALASGLSLYLGLTNKVILSGGPTIPAWAKDVLPPERTGENWPSEAELMSDVIKSRFGKIFEEKYNKPIEKSLFIESASTNTLENLAYTVENHPEIIEKNQKIGLLGGDFHLRRIALLTKLFSINVASRGEVSSQELLKERSEIANKENYKQMLDYFKDALSNSDLRSRLLGEERFERGLIDESYLAYWLGYLGKVNNPKIIQNVIKKLSHPAWVAESKRIFSEVGLDFEAISEEDLEKLSVDKFQELQQKLLKMTIPKDKGGLREMPPEWN